MHKKFQTSLGSFDSIESKPIWNCNLLMNYSFLIFAFVMRNIMNGFSYVATYLNSLSHLYHRWKIFLYDLLWHAFETQYIVYIMWRKHTILGSCAISAVENFHLHTYTYAVRPIKLELVFALPNFVCVLLCVHVYVHGCVNVCVSR